MSVTGKQLTATVLKGILTDVMAFRGFVSSLDSCVQTGYYYSNGASDCPASVHQYGILIVFATERSVTQIYIPNTITKIPIRVYRNNAWESWKSLGITSLTT